jgi:hypothetical protein
MSTNDEHVGIWKRALLKPRPLFADPSELAEAAMEYFTWVHETPVVDNVPTHYKGEMFFLEHYKIRAMSWKAFRVFLGISSSTMNYYRRNDKFAEVFSIIDDIMFSQKFEGAAAGLLNASIIQRDLGLAEKTVVEGGDKPLQMVTSEMDAKTALEAYEETLRQGGGD